MTGPRQAFLMGTVTGALAGAGIATVIVMGLCALFAGGIQ
jgi:hypothetical protein